MKRILLSLFAVLCTFGLLSQEASKIKHVLGTTCKDCKILPTVQNGTASVATSYTATACGLNWTQGSVVLEQKTVGVIASPSQGAVQPATIPISGIPSCHNIIKAFLYAASSGNGVSVTASVTNPSGTGANFPMTIIGTDVDQCWGGMGYSATYSYRADVTSIVTGNGNYILSGLPVAPSPGPNDMNGATLIIIYSDLSASYTGSIVLGDGAYVYSGSQLIKDTLRGFNACGTISNAQAFMILSDLQGINNTATIMNNTPYTENSTSQDWWNFMQVTTTVTTGQSSAVFSSSNAGDCYNTVLEGLYFQSACNTCLPSGNSTCVSSSVSSQNICQGSSDTLSVQGAITYTWSANAWSATTSSVIISPTVTTTYSLIAIAPNGDTVRQTIIVGVSTNTVIVNSASVCSGSAATLTASGAATYTWSTGNTSASISPSPTITTNYTVISGTGNCTDTAVATVTVIDPPMPDICMVSTDSLSQNNFIVWDKTLLPTADSIIAYREVSTNIYKRIGAVYKTHLSKFIDTARSVTPANGDPNIGTYRYKLQVRDTCGNYGPAGYYHNTVHVTDLHNGNFIWNTYTVENMTVTPVLNFNLMRDDNSTGTWHQVGSVAGTQTTIIDPNYFTWQSTARWRVDAVFGYVCTPSMRQGNTNQFTVLKSLSNTVTDHATALKNSDQGINVVSVYPNPASSSLFIVSSKQIEWVKMSDLLGNLVMLPVVKTSGTNFEFDVKDLPEGIYFITSKTNSGINTQKAIIQR